MTQITELQKKRAENIIWNCAGSYSFTPDFKAYDRNGTAEHYWNCIIGAVRKHYDYPQFEKILLSFQQYEESDTYEGLFWLGLENCVFRHEVTFRPALSGLRKNYAETFVKEYLPASGHFPDDYHLYDTLALAHWMRVLGSDPPFSKYDRKLLDELEFSPEMTTGEIVSAAQRLFLQWFQITTEEKKKRQFRFPGLKRSEKSKAKTRYRKFGIGIFDHPGNIYGGASAEGNADLNSPVTKMSAKELRDFMTEKYGKPIFPERQSYDLERELCTGNHENCHLHFTNGERVPAGQIKNGFEALSRQREALQIEKNKAFYQNNLAMNRTAITKLTGNIRNSVLLHLQPAPVKSEAGLLDGGKVWRAIFLDDEKVFTKLENDNMGDLCIDILLDASTSQKNRLETISSQGYIIAQSLTNCGIPCRVMSFCSMTGYTILRIFREYHSPKDNGRIFEYVANGCNRDGLAIRAAARLIKNSPYEHRILIILSDVKPNDVVKVRSAGSEEFINYDHTTGINDTAFEVRRAKEEGISVMCIFTGEDEDVPAAKTVYNRDFVRIRSFDMLADTVGKLIQDQIKNL